VAMVFLRVAQTLSRHAPGVLYAKDFFL
jgi:hypothetical protein